MKTFLRIVLGLVALVAVIVAIAYADGLTLPVNHSVTVVSVVSAPPARTLAIIADIGDGASWRSEVKSVQVLAPEDGKDHWVEDLGHGEKMEFTASQTGALDPASHAVRKVTLDGGGSYGGTWTYDISPGPAPGQTTLRITEDGFIHPPLYRFMMTHIFGPTSNLEIYMSDIQKKAAKG